MAWLVYFTPVLGVKKQVGLTDVVWVYVDVYICAMCVCVCLCVYYGCEC